MSFLNLKESILTERISLRKTVVPRYSGRAKGSRIPKLFLVVTKRNTWYYPSAMEIKIILSLSIWVSMCLLILLWWAIMKTFRIFSRKLLFKVALTIRLSLGLLSVLLLLLAIFMSINSTSNSINLRWSDTSRLRWRGNLIMSYTVRLLLLESMARVWFRSWPTHSLALFRIKPMKSSREVSARQISSS